MKLVSQATNVKKFLREYCFRYKIGSGMFRDVYDFKPDPRFVVKIERDPDKLSFANAMEFRNWVDNREWTLLGPWLAPCLIINPTGTILIQRKVDTVVGSKDLPEKIPSLFTDKRVRNWGFLDLKPVCFDYSFLLIGEKFKLVKAHWH